MIDFFLEYGLSNLLVSFILALIAWLVHRQGKYPSLARFLWLLVLVKMLLPPLVTVPIFTIPSSAAETTVLPASVPTELAALPVIETEPGPPLLELELIDKAPASSLLTIEILKSLFGGLWALGSIAVLGLSIYRIRQFDKSLGRGASEAPNEIQSLAAGLARRLGLERSPTIYWTKAKISPMLWWIGGSPQIFVPKDFARTTEPGNLRWILAHELGHYARGDHLVRIIEWLTCIIFWWNPVAWLARRYLRMNEELCCDALVLTKLNALPHNYASSLLSVIEYLASSTLRPPAMASGINSGGNLERRFKMIVSNRSLPKAPKWLPALALFCMVGFLPLGVAHAQSPDFEAVGTRLLKAVEKGELSAAQAKAMMGELARARFGERLNALAQKHHKQRNTKKGRSGKADWAQLTEAYERLGIDGVTVRKVAEVFHESGVRGEQAHRVMRGMARFLYGVKKGGQKTDRDWLTPFFKEQGLNGEQIDRAWRLTKRLSNAVRSKQGKKSNRNSQKRKPDLGAMKKKYAAIEKKIWGAVKAGKLSKKDAAKKLEKLKKEMFGGQRWNKSDKRSNNYPKEMGSLKRKYQAIEKEIRQMVRAGKLSPQEARKKLDAIRKKMFPKHRSESRRDPRDKPRAEKSMETKKRHYEAVKKKIIAAVKAGKMSRAEGGETLAKLRNKLFGDAPRKPKSASGQRRRSDLKKNSGAKRQMEAKVKKYRAALKKYQAAVEAGKMSAEEARRGLTELRQKMFGGQDRENKGHDQSKAGEKKRVWSALRQAVKSGRITEAQAKQRWNSYLKNLKEGGRRPAPDRRKKKERKRQVL